MISRHFLFPALSVAAAFLASAWLYQRHVGARLQEELAAARAKNAGLRQPEAARDRIAATQPTVEKAMVAEATVAAEPVPPDLVTASLGEWTSAAGWRNRGRFTVRDTISTMLAAAAAGDVGALQASLEFSAEIRQRAREVYAKLKPETQAQYRSPEELVAAVTLYRIPRTAAQLIWLNETDADHAIVGVMLLNPAVAAAPPPPERNAPPMLPDGSRTRLALLNLHRTGAEWRIVVPARALDEVVRELSRPPGG